jgi:hypothetical protein
VGTQSRCHVNWGGGTLHTRDTCKNRWMWLIRSAEGRRQNGRLVGAPSGDLPAWIPRNARMHKTAFCSCRVCGLWFVVSGLRFMLFMHPGCTESWGLKRVVGGMHTLVVVMVGCCYYSRDYYLLYMGSDETTPSCRSSSSTVVMRCQPTSPSQSAREGRIRKTPGDLSTLPVGHWRGRTT